MQNRARALLIIRGNIFFDGLRRQTVWRTRWSSSLYVAHRTRGKKKEICILMFARWHKEKNRIRRSPAPPTRRRKLNQVRAASGAEHEVFGHEHLPTLVRAAPQSCAGTPRGLSPPHVRGRPVVLVSSAQRLCAEQPRDRARARLVVFLSRASRRRPPARCRRLELILGPSA